MSSSLEAVFAQEKRPGLLFPLRTCRLTVLIHFQDSLIPSPLATVLKAASHLAYTDGSCFCVILSPHYE
jgi:hypothetical protein